MGARRGETFQGLPWERERSAPAWWRTVWLVTLQPRDAALKMKPEGSLVGALAFAALSFAAHAVTLSLLLVLISWRHAVAIEALFGADHPVANSAAARAGEGIVLTWLMAPCMLCVSVFVLAILTRSFGTSLPGWEHARAHSYACGLFVPATVPVVGLLSYVVFGVFLHHWLGVRTSLSSGRRGIAVVAAVLSGWLIAGAVGEEVVGALGPIPFDLVSSLVG